MKQPLTPTRTHRWLITAMTCAGLLVFRAETVAAIYSKANNSDNLNLTTSWAGGVAPTNMDIGQWDSTVTTANTVSLGANLEWLGAKIVNPGGPVTLNAGNILTLDGSGVDLSAATQDLTANCDLALGASQTWAIAAGRNFTIGGGVSGTALLTLPGPGTATFNGTSYSLGTSAAGNNALALNGGTLVVAGGTLNLAGNNNNDGAAQIQGGATFKQTGGVVNSSFYTRVGSTGRGTLIVSGGQFNNAGEILFAYSGSNPGGILVVSNTGTFNAHFLRAGQNGPCTINLDGGRVIADRIYCNNGQGYFYFNGGTLQVNGSPATPWFDASVPFVYVKNGGAFVDTAGQGVTLAANLQPYSSSTGGLTKTGLGTLTLTGTNNYAGPSSVTTGTLVINGRNNGTGPTTINSGGTLGGTGVVAGAVSVLDGGGLALGTGALSVGNLTLGANATLSLTLGAPGNPANGSLQVNGNLILNGSISVSDNGGMSTGAVYSVIHYTGALTNLGLAENPFSQWNVTVDTSLTHYVRITATSKLPFLEITSGNLAVNSLTTNLVALIRGAAGNVAWYEVRANNPAGNLLDFGAHLSATIWPFIVRHLIGGTNWVTVFTQDNAGNTYSNGVALVLNLSPTSPVRPRPIPAEIWWGGLSDNTQMTNYSEWPFVQKYEDGYFFHSAGWGGNTATLQQSLAQNLRTFNTKYWPELGGGIGNPNTNSGHAQAAAWGGWAAGCQANGIIWSEFTHDYHMENMQPVCQVNPAWPNNDQIAWWTGDLSVADATYPYATGIWRDAYNDYYAQFPQIKVGETSSPVWWPWDVYPALDGNNLAFTVTNSSGQTIPFSFTAHEIVASFINMASAINHPYYSQQTDCPWDYFGFNGLLSTGAQNREKIRVYEQYLQSRGCRHTLICNVSNAGTNQQGSVSAADLYYENSSLSSLYLHQREGGRANRYLFESWYAGIPYAVVPETQPGSYTHLALSAIKYLKGIADTNGNLEQLNLTPTATNGTVAQLQLQNNGDVPCLPALAGQLGTVAGVSTRYFSPNGAELTATILTAEGFCYTNLLPPGAKTNFFAVTLANNLSAATNDNAYVEAFWNPQDPLGIVRDRAFFAVPLNPPDLWNDADIGSVGVTGGSALSGTNFTLLGSGADIWGVADACHFVYQTHSGDGTFTARVTSQTAADVWSKAGVMVRENISAGARNAFVCVTPNNGVSFQNRSATNGASYNTALGGLVAPYWMRLTRSGTTFTAQCSADGANWVTVGSSNVTGFAASAWWGLAVTAHNNALASAATFDHVALPNAAPTLVPIADQTLVVGQTLTVTNVATDPDSPPQTLTFTLLTAPVGMTLNATNGMLAWRPAIAQSPTTNTVSVAVTDNGTPPLNATQSFLVTVTSPVPPTLAFAGFSHGIFSLLVAGDTGPDYVLQSVTNLNPLVVWLALQTNPAATPPFTFADSGATNGNQKFYRVLLGP